MLQRPLVSLIIITWNSKDHISICPDRLLTQTCNDFEVILVDRGSVAGSLDGLAERYPAFDLLVERLDANQGFAVANNIGARLTRGKRLAISYEGARPVPVEPDSYAYNLDPGCVESSIGSQTRAILAVHLYGMPTDMDPLMTLADKYDLKVIEDAAQA